MFCFPLRWLAALLLPHKQLPKNKNLPCWCLLVAVAHSFCICLIIVCRPHHSAQLSIHHSLFAIPISVLSVFYRMSPLASASVFESASAVHPHQRPTPPPPPPRV
ncbi:hypothetical protein E2542_SST26978 [Spatholobus suberectus]|nr:hypothetical protein E2542_SST26978 [Spatholobus suberectus]